MNTPLKWVPLKTELLLSSSEEMNEQWHVMQSDISVHYQPKLIMLKHTPACYTSHLLYSSWEHFKLSISITSREDAYIVQVIRSDLQQQSRLY
jgi:hypothetical protein